MITLQSERIAAAYQLGRHDYSENKPMIVPVYLTSKEHVAYVDGYQSAMNVQSESQARYLAARDTTGDYVARKIKGQWYVWSTAVESIVEFDDKSLTQARKADF
jgi:hypothetical protein